jgi:hypothetical protein
MKLYSDSLLYLPLAFNWIDICLFTFPARQQHEHDTDTRQAED